KLNSCLSSSPSKISNDKGKTSFGLGQIRKRKGNDYDIPFTNFPSLILLWPQPVFFREDSLALAVSIPSLIILVLRK
ncbi:hypothetical protein, partial [Candidatus Hakubella thermalkaliphila]|uniref:hypothetical protein n=1 Tax=Candidatus Hakubella thermalkaliphila TaxID=2754717 RepID=UPI001C615159